MVLANKGPTPFTVLWCCANAEAQDNDHNAEQGKQPHISVHQGPDRHLAQCVLLQTRCDHDEPAVFTPVFAVSHRVHGIDRHVRTQENLQVGRQEEVHALDHPQRESEEVERVRVRRLCARSRAV